MNVQDIAAKVAGGVFGCEIFNESGSTAMLATDESSTLVALQQDDNVLIAYLRDQYGVEIGRADLTNLPEAMVVAIVTAMVEAGR